MRKVEHEEMVPAFAKGEIYFRLSVIRHVNARSHDPLPSNPDPTSTCGLVLPFAGRLRHTHRSTTTTQAPPTSPLRCQLPCNMSAQAAAKAASQAAKAAAQNDRGFLNRGAKRDPELYVRAVCRIVL